ncbi:hypothetical protein [Streptomyces sp. SID3915]|uniref:hypothetical protein n=1 Tax=Streptomyces sp. SID3915 TaxID=2690263 RepID=UPI00136EA50B|nr:hypothetical protein [Streptomyces sp. SID3915]MYX75078.1 hypothetical protein [Streptomyces sp. SID3915]
MGLFSSKPPKPTAADRDAANKAISDRRRAEAAAHYRATGDSSHMWAEKSRHVNASIKVTTYDASGQGRREAKREARRNRWLSA